MSSIVGRARVLRRRPGPPRPTARSGSPATSSSRPSDRAVGLDREREGPRLLAAEGERRTAADRPMRPGAADDPGDLSARVCEDGGAAAGELVGDGAVDERPEGQEDEQGQAAAPGDEPAPRPPQERGVVAGAVAPRPPGRGERVSEHGRGTRRRGRSRSTRRRRRRASCAAGGCTPRPCSASAPRRTARPGRGAGRATGPGPGRRRRHSRIAYSRWLRSTGAPPTVTRRSVSSRTIGPARRVRPRRGGGRRPERPEAGEQLLVGERLDEVVVGAGVEALDPGGDRVAGGEHEDRHGGAARPAGGGRRRSRSRRGGRRRG